MSFTKEFDSFASTVAAPNILITGRCGSGKSTLLNAVFGSKISETGVSFGPLTKSFVRYGPMNGIPLTLFDSAGFEMGKQEAFVDDTRQFLDSQQKQGPASQIHLVWYVINTPLSHFETFERAIFRGFKKRRIPIIAVLAQCDGASEAERLQMHNILKQTVGEMAHAIVEVSAHPLEVDGEPICAPFGLDELVTESVERLPEIYRHAFVASQLISTKAKRKTAYAYVTAAAGLCFATGYLPVPFTSPLSAYLAQQHLAVKLASVYGYKDNRTILNTLRELIKSTEALTMFVSTSVLNLFLFNPITSTLAGCAAAAYMMMVGLSFAGTFEEMANMEIEGLSREQVDEQFRLTFRTQFQSWRRRIRIRSSADLDKFKEDFVRGY
jgi:predicted GTPase